MRRGERAVLRTVERDDVPTPAGRDQRYDTCPEHRAGGGFVPFAITVDDELVGSTSPWGIDPHNRRARLLEVLESNATAIGSTRRPGSARTAGCASPRGCVWLRGRGLHGDLHERPAHEFRG